MKLKALLFLPLIYTLSTCSPRDAPDKKKPEIIDIENAFENRKPININDISNDLEFIILETKSEYITGRNLKVYSDGQYLVAIDKTQILIFDRKTGKFIRKIGQMGNGPEEYSKPYTKMPFDEESKVVYADRNQERYEYALDGQLINIKKGPELVYDFVNINDNTYAAFIDNYMGDEKNKMIIFNERDSIIKIFPNYLSFPKGGQINIYTTNSWFYKLNKRLCFCEKFSDTLYSVTQNSLSPRFVFDNGVYSFPYELRGSTINPADKYFFTENILESSKYLFYSFRYNKEVYTAVYDKKQKNTFVNDYIGDSGNGFLNNVNEFVPLELSSINEKGELIGIIEAYKIKLWFEENPEKIKQLPDYLKTLKNIQETNNPVIIIAKLKN